MFGGGPATHARRLCHLTQLGNRRVARVARHRHRNRPSPRPPEPAHTSAPWHGDDRSARHPDSLVPGHSRRVLYRARTKTHTLRYGAVSTDHHRRIADDLLCRRGRSGPAVRRPPDASLAVGDSHHLPALWPAPSAGCCWVGPTRSPWARKQRQRPKAPDDDIDFLRGL